MSIYALHSAYMYHTPTHLVKALNHSKIAVSRPNGYLKPLVAGRNYLCTVHKIVMAELQAPNSVHLSPTQAVDDDLESQPTSINASIRRTAINRPIILRHLKPTPLQYVPAVIAGAIAPDQRGLPTSAIEPLQLFTSPLFTELPESSKDAQVLHRRYQADRISDENGKAKPVQPKRQRRPRAPTRSEVNHSNRKGEIESFLNPLLPLQDSPLDSFILICWGKHDSCHIKSIFVPGDCSDADIWKSVRDTWPRSRSVLRGRLTWLLKIKTVDIVTVSYFARLPILGPVLRGD